jgi:hypothetical protein
MIYPAEFPGVSVSNLDALPVLAGIYFAMQDDEILYVGQSRNIHRRWKDHHKRKELTQISGVTIHWTESDGRPLLEQEAEWIRYCHPPLNRSITKLEYLYADFPTISKKISIAPIIVLQVLNNIYFVACIFLLKEYPFLDIVTAINLLVFSFVIGSMLSWKDAKEKYEKYFDLEQ